MLVAYEHFWIRTQVEWIYQIHKLCCGLGIRVSAVPYRCRRKARAACLSKSQVVTTTLVDHGRPTLAGMESYKRALLKSPFVLLMVVLQGGSRDKCLQAQRLLLLVVYDLEL